MIKHKYRQAFSFIGVLAGAAMAFAPLTSSAAMIGNNNGRGNDNGNGHGQIEASTHANANASFNRPFDNNGNILSNIFSAVKNNVGSKVAAAATVNNGPVSPIKNDPPAPLAANTMPVISGITAPVVLSTGQTGTWTVNAFDPQNSPLTYSVDWGDSAPTPLLRAALALPVFTQTGTFTHDYTNPGTYTVTFNVKNSTGEVTTSTVTVHITGQAQIVPTVSDVAVSNVTTHQATVTWNTDVKADSSVWVSSTTPVDTSVPANITRNANITSHSIVLTQLEPGTTYYVVVGSADQFGTGMSSETSFTTTAVVNKNAPTISSLDGSSTIAVGDTETVTVNASDPKNSPLTYNVNWGDNPPVMFAALARVQPVTQTSTFTHVYANPGTYNAEFTVTNAAGLSTSSSLSITVTPSITSPDTVPPVITLNGSSTINLMVGDTYTELGATATDNVDGTDPVAISGDTVDTSVAGTYIVKYDATDAAGNQATEVTRTVIVSSSSTDTTPPVISNIAGSPGSTAATATWTTDEPATSAIYYSTTAPVDPSSSSTPSVVDPTLTTNHSVTLTGLTPSTLYNYVIESADAAGNVASTFDSTFTTTSQ